MRETKQRATLWTEWRVLPVYDKFEQFIVFVLTVLISVIIVSALWNLTAKIFHSLILTESFDPTEFEVFRGVFGMIFTVIIALEFKRSILVATERRRGIVQVRAVILIAMLAVVRKLIILDLAEIEALKVIGLGSIVLALGVVYWLVRDQDRKERESTP